MCQIRSITPSVRPTAAAHERYLNSKIICSQYENIQHGWMINNKSADLWCKTFHRGSVTLARLLIENFCWSWAWLLLFLFLPHFLYLFHGRKKRDIRWAHKVTPIPIGPQETACKQLQNSYPAFPNISYNSLRRRRRWNTGRREKYQHIHWWEEKVEGGETECTKYLR